MPDFTRSVLAAAVAATIFICAFIVLATAPVFAISMNSDYKANGHIEIQLQGKLSKGDEIFFERYYRSMRAKAAVDGISLSSDGGLVDVGLSIGRIVHETGMYTYVPAKKSCSSACVLIFVSSDNKFIDVTGAVKVHQASNCLDDKPSDLPCINDKISAHGTQLMAEYYKLNGVPDRVITKMQTTRPYWLTMLTPSDLESMGVKLMGMAPASGRATFMLSQPIAGWRGGCSLC